MNQRTQSQRTAQTKAALIEKARTLFASKGFTGVATEQLVEACGLSRGALYHHFKGKLGLFEAVVEGIQAEVTQKIAAAANAAKDPWQGIKAGCLAFVHACNREDIRQILLVDAISVLGMARWREIDSQNAVASLRQGLRESMAAGLLSEQPLEPLARLISGAVNEAALWLSEQPPSASTQAEMDRTLSRMLEAIASM